MHSVIRERLAAAGIDSSSKELEPREYVLLVSFLESRSSVDRAGIETREFSLEDATGEEERKLLRSLPIPMDEVVRGLCQRL